MLKTGQSVTVTTSSYPNDRFEGRITVINPFLEQAKRTAKVRIDISNPDFKLRPGMYSNVELGMDMGEGLVVPASAVMPTGSREIAFVDKGGGKLEPRDSRVVDRRLLHSEVCAAHILFGEDWNAAKNHGGVHAILDAPRNRRAAKQPG